MKRKAYKVELQSGCTIVMAPTLKRAEKWAREYFGRIQFKSVDEATEADQEHVKMMGGVFHDSDE